MSDPDYSRKHALECLRLASDCMQLVGDVSSPDLQSHFLHMARVWSDLAVRGPDAKTQSSEKIMLNQNARATIDSI